MRIVITILGILCGVHFLSAQDSLKITAAPSPAIAEDVIEQKLDRIDQRLGLLPDQRASIREVLITFTEKYGDQPPATKDEKRQRRRALRQAVSALLTPEQIARIKESRKNASGNLPKNNSGSPSPTPKRSFLDILLDDIATPLLEKRKRNY
ncbi:hypothetical protein [Lewinella sp. W8]|uniref:hypothetical protein n=1 Tax=Lewinella sp. W8 TaxID=2528208 RepID=UPI001067D77A|nr:hypothetical protein [Lewinella sp. W8]MTB53738.1 hypothetical protein [Lewinella sp. W8]